MNILLTAAGIIGKDEFVISPAPNVYITVLRITPEQAEHFGGNLRIGIQTEIGDEDAGCTEVLGVGDDNRTNGWKLSDSGPVATAEQLAVIHSLEDRELAAITAFIDEVGHDDLEEVYQQLQLQSIQEKIRAVLGQLKA